MVAILDACTVCAFFASPYNIGTSLGDMQQVIARSFSFLSYQIIGIQSLQELGIFKVEY
jgi:hypothetical protein